MTGPLDVVYAIPEKEQMKNSHWPGMIPPDLRSRLEAVLGGRNRPLAADVWTELRDWLVQHQAQPPENLPRDKTNAAFEEWKR